MRVQASKYVLDFLKDRGVYFNVKGYEYSSRFKPGENLTFNNNILVESNTCFINGSNIITIGSYSFTRSPLPSGVSIGRYCSIGARVRVLGPDHPVERFTTSSITYDSQFCISRDIKDENILSQANNIISKVNVNIGNDVWIGEGATLKRNITIGNGAVIAANSLVTKDVPPYTIVGGIPAKIIKDRFSDDIVSELESYSWWQYELSSFIQGQLDLPIDLFIISLKEAIDHGLVRKLTPLVTRAEDLNNLHDDVKS